MNQVLLIISALLTIGAVVPYIIDVIKRKTKPRIVSWFIWTVLMVIAGTAALADGNVASSVLSFSAATATFLVVVLGYRYSDKSFTKLDIFSFIGACVGLLLWWLFDSPTIALVLSVVIDFMGAIPTVWHAYKEPQEETLSTFVASGLGAVFALIAVSSASFASLLVPVYLIVINSSITVILSIRRRDKTNV